MADGSASFKGGAAPIVTGAPAAPAAGTGSSPAKAQSVSDLISVLTAPTKLSKEGEDYIKTIVDLMTREGREPKVTTILGSNYEARILEYNNYITAILPVETYVPGTPALPPASVSDDLRNRINAKGIPGELALFLVVTKEDYERADTMAAKIVNVYKFHDTPVLKNITAVALSKGNYGLTDDLATITPFVRQHCPHAMLPRMDAAIMLYESRPTENAFGYGNNGRPQFEQTPILAVTGYTDFVYAENQINGITGGETKYVPYFVITGFWGPLVDTATFVIGLPLLSFLMINKSFWAKQFSSFKKDKPDIGNLLNDKDTGKPFQTKDIQQRNQIIMTYLTQPHPVLAIDLQLGSFMIPGLGKIIDNPAVFNQIVDNFTGGNGAASVGKPIQGQAYNFDGRIRMGKMGDYFDTRCVDYLSLIKSGYSSTDASRFLRQDLVPAGRSQAVQQVYPDAELLYITYRTYLQPAYVIAISNDLSQTLHVHIDAAMDAGTFNIGALTTWQQAGLGSMNSFSVANNLGTFSSGWGWC